MGADTLRHCGGLRKTWNFKDLLFPRSVGLTHLGTLLAPCGSQVSPLRRITTRGRTEAQRPDALTPPNSVIYLSEVGPMVAIDTKQRL